MKEYLLYFLCAFAGSAIVNLGIVWINKRSKK